MAPTYAFDVRGRIKVEPKEKIKERLRRSPDRADALRLPSGHCYQEGSCASRGCGSSWKLLAPRIQFLYRYVTGTMAARRRRDTAALRKRVRSQNSTEGCSFSVQMLARPGIDRSRPANRRASFRGMLLRGRLPDRY